MVVSYDEKRWHWFDAACPGAHRIYTVCLADAAQTMVEEVDVRAHDGDHARDIAAALLESGEYDSKLGIFGVAPERCGLFC